MKMVPTPDNSIALIMARGGSQRIPRKNTRPFLGLPMVVWPVRAAAASGIFGQVVISTEDEEIAGIAVQEGAQRPFVRPEKLADAFSNTADVIRHALTELQARNGTMPAYCCCLYGTAYATTPEMLRQGQALLAMPGTELVMGAIQYSHPIERALTIDEEGTAAYRQPGFVLRRTQDLQPSYYDAALFYWLDSQAFLAKGGNSFLPLAKRLLVVTRLAAMDIDTEEDWAFAEQLARHQNAQE
jgi:N-acylneuraminate cytidylyltransferase